MRIGTALFGFTVILIASGYLLSDNRHISQDLQEAQQIIADITRERDALRTNLNDLLIQLANLRHENDLLLQQIGLAESQAKDFQEQCVRLSDENAQLRAQIDRWNTLNSFMGHLKTLSPGSLMLAILVPLLPISLATSFFIYGHGKNHRTPQMQQPAPSDRTLSIRVTEEEMRWIQHMRRK
jgi:hypothetical protein